MDTAAAIGVSHTPACPVVAVHVLDATSSPGTRMVTVPGICANTSFGGAPALRSKRQVNGANTPGCTSTALAAEFSAACMLAKGLLMSPATPVASLPLNATVAMIGADEMNG